MMILRVWTAGVVVALGAARVLHAGEPPICRIGSGDEHAVEIVGGSGVLMRSPAEGLWSVATAWADDWPAEWRHARPESVTNAGEWTVVSGHLDLPQGRLHLRDAYRGEGETVRGVRRFTWTGKTPLSNCTLSVRWVIPDATNAKPILPGILYYGNPMGGRHPAAVSNFTVAAHRGLPGEESLFEEHRYPVPMAVAEWQDGDAWRSAALHALPSQVPGGRLPDQWWSLGLASRSNGTELLQLSGPCAINGRRSFVKTFAHGGMPYPDAWMTLRPGDVVEKSFGLQVCPEVRQGSGFRAPVRAALALHAPFGVEGLPAFDAIVRAKYRHARTRFHDRPGDPGFAMYGDGRPNYVMGWCGQADAAGAALLTLASRLGDPRALEMATRSLDFLSTAPVDAGGFPVSYDGGAGRWGGRDHVSMGQAMESIARAVRTGRAMRLDHAGRWEAFLRKACDAHAARILDDRWRPHSTAEAYYVSPLCLGYALLGDRRFEQAALKAAAHFAGRHIPMVEPYWGGSLDATCEDKEAAQAALQAFVAVYEMTRDPRHLEWAAHALETLLTWTVVWDIPMPPSRLGDHGVKLRGFTTVSAQHHHADFYGITVTPEIYRMGGHLKRDDLKRLALVMFRGEGQMIDAWGSQGEQFNQTNFAMTGEKDLFRMRGTYSEGHTPFWICAHFLAAAAEFERMGVDPDAADPGAPRETAK